MIILSLTLAQDVISSVVEKSQQYKIGLDLSTAVDMTIALSYYFN